MAIKTVFAVFLVLSGFAAISMGRNIHISNSKLTLTGSGTFRTDRRFPVILSGDLIALKLSRSSGAPRWMQCSKSSYCTTSTCPGGQVMLSSKFSSCRTVVFRIRALGRLDGEAVESGDYVALTFPYNGGKTLYCYRSTSKPCRALWALPKVWPKKNWFGWVQGRFQIFSRNVNDGHPIQYQDIVGFKYNFQSNGAWLYSTSNKMYARSCSYGYYTKSYCAKMNSGFGFHIYKKL
ncbi:uncharacterized protein LOC110247610 isoform X2 [Exaiptasia diaphana]|uniref:Uncharacterized protein n=1 Tax=Exaiptasia diaphana TaxID=2652724 RepID=A0A913YSG7_EXADI|nr:uncharacterized protein LOC110247610 isoform X2 [Exaiptasia diaphana]